MHVAVLLSTDRRGSSIDAMSCKRCVAFAKAKTDGEDRIVADEFVSMDCNTFVFTCLSSIIGPLISNVAIDHFKLLLVLYYGPDLIGLEIEMILSFPCILKEASDTRIRSSERASE